MEKETSHGFAAWEDKTKLFQAAFKGGLNNKNRHKFSSDKAREAVRKRWAKYREMKLNSDVVQY